MKSVRLLLTIALAVLLSSGCGDKQRNAGDDADGKGGIRGILNGTTDSTSFPAVVKLNVGANICTGTIIHPNIVLTAAHCVANQGTSSPYFAPTQITGAISVVVGAQTISVPSSNVKFPSNFLKIVHNYQVPGFAIDEPNHFKGMDVALLKLDTPVTNRVPVPIDLSGSVTIPNGSQATMIGFGANTSTATSVNAGGNVRRIGISVFSGYFNSFAIESALYPLNGFSASGLRNNKALVSKGYILLTLGDSHQIACAGDSGGPAIVSTEGVPSIRGIVSFGDDADVSNVDRCIDRQFSYYTHTGAPAVSNFIRSAAFQLGIAVPVTSPTNLTAMALTNNEGIDLQWNYGSLEEQSTEIWRRDGFSGPYTRIVELVRLPGEASRTYKDASIMFSNSVNYSYKLRAANIAGFASNYSSEVILPVSPTNLSVSISQNRPLISWAHAGGTNLSGFRVERKDSINNNYFRVRTSLAYTERSYRDPNPAPGESPIYRVIALNGLAQSIPTSDVSIAVPNQAPTAKVSAITMNEDATAFIPFTGGDPDGQQITFVIGTNPSHGAFTASTTTSKTYKPSLDYSGEDSFTIKAFDGISYSAPVTVNITIVAVNDSPVALAPATPYQTDEDTAKTIELLGSDVEEGLNVQYSIVTAPAKGQLSGTVPNLVYTPDLNSNGSDSFTFKVNDGALDSNIATVNINITPVNDAPIVPSSVRLDMNEDTAKTFTLTGTDIEGSNLTFSIVTNPEHGSVMPSATGYTYTPSSNYNGSDSFTYRASDGNLQSGVGTIEIVVAAVNDLPVTTGQSNTTNEDTELPITLSGTDLDGDSLTYSIVNQPTKGSVTITGSVAAFKPNLNVSGTDSFTFKASDGKGGNSNSSTISITITAVNDAPTANPKTITVNEDVLSKTIALNGSDPEGSELTARIIINPKFGVLSGALPNKKYRGNLNYSGLDSFTYAVKDPQGLESVPVTVSITVAAVNDAPVLTSGTIKKKRQGQRFVTFSLPVTDVDNSTLTYTITTNPKKGVLSPVGTGGTVTYTLKKGQALTVTDSFRFKASDGSLTTAAKIVNVTN